MRTHFLIFTWVSAEVNTNSSGIGLEAPTSACATMQNMARKVLMGTLLLAGAFFIIVLVGQMGFGKKIGAPGLDAIAARVFEKLTGSDGAGSSPDTTPPWNIEEIAGTWSGVSDVDGAFWQFTFEKNFAVRANSSSGYSNQGTAFVHWQLGLTGGSLRVPPGWSPLDVDIIDSTEQHHRNTSSLGAFSLKGKVLHYCFGEPGKMLRPSNDLSREGIRCFELVRAGTGIPAKRTNAPPGRRAPAPPVPSAAGNGPQGLSGEAEIVMNNVTERWPLRTDLQSATSIPHPRRMTLQFQAHGTQFPAARRIEIALDATRAGRHHADGQVYLESRFIRERVAVGSSPRGEPEAVFLYIADGGQIFPPQSSCAVIVMSPYRGETDVLLEGRVSGCTVSSAGVSQEITSVAFRVQRGVRR